MDRTIFIFRLFLIAGTVLLLNQSINAQAFITTWKTNNPGSSNNTSITIPTTGAGYNYDVDWNNDGTFDEFGLTGDKTHDFGATGTYIIRIKGTFPRIYFNNTGDKLKIINIVQWGNIEWDNMNNAFYGCSNLTCTATDVADVQGVNDFSNAFNLCTVFNGDLSGWYMADALYLDAMFHSATVFNTNVSSWQVDRVRDFSDMFNSAISFNQNINTWNTSSASNMGGMFANAVNFNQRLDAWNTSSVSNFKGMFFQAIAFNKDIGGWETGNATVMDLMFSNAIAFNQDISSWRTRRVENMSRMFEGATDFDQNLGGWDISNIPAYTSANTSLDKMFDNSGMSVTNYDNTIIGWANLANTPKTAAVNSGVRVTAVNVSYCNSVAERADLISNFGWTISGDANDCTGLPIELAHFNVKFENNVTNIYWETLSEINNDYFTIEKSSDGNTWINLLKIDGAGNSNISLEYKAVDENPNLGQNYYRLKQTDFDGTHSYSEIKSINFNNEENLDFVLFPVPSTNELFIQINDRTEENIKVFNYLGENINLKSTSNNNVISLNVSNLPQGVYYVELNGVTKPFVKN